MTTQHETRHVTLTVTHPVLAGDAPGDSGHRTQDKRLDVLTARRIEARVDGLYEVPGGGRLVRLYSSGPGGVVDLPGVEVDDNTAGEVIADMKAYMRDAS